MIIKRKSLDASLIKARVNIVDIINKYLPLSISGKQMKGSCPFHEEKTPSFFVDAVKQKFHCFGCGADGDVIKFIMEINGLSFRESLVLLAKESGLDFESLKKDDFLDKSREHLNLISEFFESSLRCNKIAREYVYFVRRFKEETIKIFRIGYCPKDSNSIENFIAKNNLDKNLLLDLGILYFSKKNNLFFCPFYGRITFPIFDRQNKIIAFGARKIEEATFGAKYINSKESKIFIKNSCLYGFYPQQFSREENNMAILVEGYTDVIALIESGAKNIFASMGTAIRSEQLSILWHKIGYREICVCLDGDGAGEAAMMKIALTALGVLEPGKEMFFVRIEENTDPCNIVKQNEGDFDKLIAKKISLCDFLFYKFFLNTDVSVPERASFVRKKLDNILSPIRDLLLKEEYKKYFERKLFYREGNIEDIKYSFSKNKSDKKNLNLCLGNYTVKEKAIFSKTFLGLLNGVGDLISKIEISIACEYPSIFYISEISEEFLRVISNDGILNDAKALIINIIDEAKDINEINLKKFLTDHFGEKIYPCFVNLDSYGIYSKEIAIEKYSQLRSIYGEIIFYKAELKKIFDRHNKSEDKIKDGLFEQLISIKRKIHLVYGKLRSFC